jgi:hypothetical protein
MAAEVLTEIPGICGALRIHGLGRWYEQRVRCGRVAKHRGDHFDVLRGIVWATVGRTRYAWPGLDAGDVTCHFDCHPQHCHWAPLSA